MADGEVIIAIDGDSTGFEKEVTGTKAQAAKLAAEYKKQGLSSSDAFKKAWADIKGASEDGADAVAKDAQGIGKSFTAAGKESSAAVEKAFDDVKEASSEAARTVEEKADNASNSFDKIKSAGALALGAVATAAMSAGTALAGIGAYAVKVGSDFEAGMSEVQAISRASSDEMEALAEKAKVMGAQTKFSASESADAFKFMAQAGWDAQAMLDGIGGVMDLAAASGEDLALTSSIVTDTLTAFGMAASDAGHFADVLAMAANASNTGVAEMGYTFKYVAPVAGALGYSIEDVSVAIGLMANSGIKAETAGTALRATLTNLAKPSDDVAMYMERLGVSLTDSGGKVKPLNALMDQLRGSFAKLTDAQKAEYAAGLAGKEAMSGLLAIVNASDSDYKSLTQNINNAGGAAEEAADIMQDNLKGAVEELGGGLETVGLQIYDSLQTPLKEAAKSANANVSEISNSLKNGQLKASMDTLSKSAGEMVEAGADLASKVIPKLINNLAYLVNHGRQVAGVIKGAAGAFVVFKAAATVDAVGKSFQAASTAVSAYTVAQKMAATSQAATAGSLTLYQSAVGVMTGQLSIATVAQGALNAAMAASPVLVITAGVAALIGGLALLGAATRDATNEFEEFDKKSKELRAELEKQKEANEQLAAARSENLAKSEAEINAVQSYVRELKSYLDENGAVEESHKARAEYLANEINTLIPGAVEALESEQEARYKIKDTIDQEILSKQKSLALDAMHAEYIDALEKRDETEQHLTTALQQKGEAQQHLNDLQAKEQALIEASHEAQSSLSQTAEYDGRILTLGEVIELQRQNAEATEVANQKFKDANDEVQEFQGNLDHYSEILQRVADISAAGSTEEFQKAVSGLSDTVVQFTGDNQTALADAVVASQVNYDRMVAVAAKSWETMSEDERNASTERLKSFKDTLDQQVQAAIDGGLNIAKGTGEGAARGMYVFPAAIQTGIDEAKKKLKTAGIDVVGSGNNFGAGFSTGVAGSIDEILKTVASLGTQSVGQLNTTLDEHSPSRKTRTSGQYFSQGMELGILDGKSGVINAAVKVAQAGIKAAKDTLQIKSPSRVMREQVGRMLAMGMALGIGDGEDAVKAAVTLLSEGAINSARDEATTFKEVGSLYMDNLTYGIEAGRDRSITAMEQAVKADVEAYKKKVDSETDALVKAKQKQMEKVGKVQKTALQKEIDTIKSDADKKKKAYEDAGKEVTDGYKTALTEGYDEALSIVKQKVTDITDEFQAAHDDLIDRQEAMQSKLSEFGDLFTINDSGDLSLNNLEKNIDAIGRYQDALTELKDKGVSDEFMQQVTSLGVEEGTKFAEKLLQLTPDAFEKYTTTWQEQQDLAKTVAQQFYADQLTALDEDFTQKLDGALENVPTLLAGIGEDSIQGMIDGMYSKSGALSTAARSIVSAAIQAMRDAADIHSPSRKVAKLVGAPMAEGVAVGFDKQMADVYRQVSQTLDGEIGKMSAEVKVQADRQAAQSSPAPVQTIMRTEVIEKTPVIKFDGTLGALARVLQPEIEIVKKHKGGNLVKGEI